MCVRDTPVCVCNALFPRLETTQHRNIAHTRTHVCAHAHICTYICPPISGRCDIMRIINY